MLPVACIFAGKLAGRGLRLPARDVFDIGVGIQQSPDALACAVNHLDTPARAEIIATGIRPRMIAQYGMIEKLMQVAERAFASRGSARLD